MGEFKKMKDINYKELLISIMAYGQVFFNDRDLASAEKAEKLLIQVYRQALKNNADFGKINANNVAEAWRNLLKRETGLSWSKFLEFTGINLPVFNREISLFLNENPNFIFKKKWKLKNKERGN